ncbi:MAG: hypothetical protein M1357_02035 [Candidatus Marsarchaeota archaeon]|nr:hypothetical protein [Candidatus Marsarchaeota archaeon]
MFSEMRPSRKAAVIALFTAVSLSTDYLMLPLPNVKLMDTMVFMAGYIYGVDVGCSVAALSWLIYGTFNPLGAATPGLLAVMIAGECLYAVAGGVMRRQPLVKGASASIRFGAAGFLCAFIYDFITNAYTGIYWYGSVVRALVLGIPFAVMHEVTDFAFFSAIVPATISVLQGMGKTGVNRYVKTRK